jgi:hypothetical protein
MGAEETTGEGQSAHVFVPNTSYYTANIVGALPDMQYYAHDANGCILQIELKEEYQCLE